MALRQKINFPNRFNLIWVVQSSRKKYFPWLQPQITGNFREEEAKALIAKIHEAIGK